MERSLLELFWGREFKVRALLGLEETATRDTRSLVFTVSGHLQQGL